MVVITFSSYVLPLEGFAAESTNYRLSTFAITNAGEEGEGGDYDLDRNTLGEAVSGDSESANIKAKSGFLHTIVRDETDPPLPPPDTDYLAKSANFRQTAYLFSIADVKGSSENFDLVSGAVGEPTGGTFEGYYRKSFSGHIYTILDNPPVLTQSIPAQSWLINTAKSDAFDLDDYFVDPDDDDLTFSVSGNIEIVVNIDPETHQVSFSQGSGFSGREEIIITASDFQGNQASSNPITLNVHLSSGAGNNAPLLEYLADITAKEGELITIAPIATDPDGDDISYSFSAPFDAQGAWQTDYQNAGTYNITVTASDGSLTDSQEITLTVLNVNRKPTLGHIADITGPENQLITITPSGSDPDGDELSFSFSAPFNQHGQWLPSYHDAGAHTVTVTASDGSLSDSQDVLLNITDVNTTPTVSISLDRINAELDQAVTFIVSASDADDDSLILTLDKDGSQFYSAGIYDFYVGSTSFPSLGVHTITATVDDGHGGVAHASVNIEIINAKELWNKILPLLGDFNGDALVDIGTYNRDTGRWAVALSNLKGFGSVTEWLTNFGNSTDWLYVNGDFNGDGKTDIAIFNQQSGQWHVQTSDGAGFIDQGLWATFANATNLSVPITGDFNGDGVSDGGVYYRSNGQVRWALSNKSGFDSVSTWSSTFPYSDQAQPFSGDFNGDGLIDIGVFVDGNLSFAVSSGTDFITRSGWSINFGADKTPVVSDFNNDGLTDIGAFTKDSGRWQVYHSTGDGFVSGGDWLNDFGQGEYNTVYALDFNADGLTDASAFNNSTFSWQRLAAQGDVADLLKKITNSLGGTTEISYTSSVHYDNTGDDAQCDLPFAMQTVSSVKQGDGLGNFYSTSYLYADGLYVSAERETRGFGYVKVTDVQGNASESWFNQDDIFKGLPYQAQISDSSGNLYVETNKTYDYTTPYTGCTFARLIEEQASNYEGQITPRTTRTTYEYDNYGNPIKVTNLGDVNVVGDEKVSNIEYVYDQGLWILGLPCHNYLEDAQAQIVSQNWLYYDGNTSWQNQTLSRTLLTKEEAWLDTGSNPTTSYNYDEYGNLLTATDALGNATTTTYEPTYYTFPQTITNTLGHTVQYTYDPKTGQILTSTDPNGQVTTNEYDILGRLIKVFGPNDLSYPGIEYDYDLTANPAKITTTSREEHDTTDPNKIHTSYAFYDGLGRLIQAKSEAEASAKQIASGIVSFDSRGKPEHKYLPYEVDETTEYTSPDFNQPKVTFDYDCLGRVIKQTNADATYATVEYFPGIVVATDENGHKISKHQDAYGQTVKIEEWNYGRIYTTSYKYDAQGNLLDTIDDKGNVTAITYDSLGRKAAMDDPDMGEWSYEYDANGNLIKQTDAKGQILEFTYDSLNRLTGKPADGLTIVTYSYDDTSKPNCIGRLSKITDQSGQTEFFYDNLGREIMTTKTVSSKPYTVSRSYDALDRLISVTYPNGKIAQYSYNKQGGIETVTTPNGSISNIDYTASSQIELIQYSNGTETVYDYNPNTLRLSHLETTSSGTTLQDLTYTFDNVGNVSTISDNSPEGTNSQSFQYDDLHRLISADGSYGTMAYEYDSIGNMTRKGDLHLTYGEDGAGPHAVTSASGSKSFAMAYDANGNMLSKGQAQYQYDIENRLIQTEAPQSGGQPTTIDIFLSVGWNYIALPVELADYSIAAVLSSIEGSYEQVTRYNSTSGEFESFVNNTKYDEFTDFTFGEGYMIYINQACTLTVTGQTSSGQAHQLKAGWNLMASPTLKDEIATEAALNNLVQGTDYDKVAEYNGTDFTYDPAIFKKGKAYYVYMLQDKTWQIPVDKAITTFTYDGDGGRVKRTTSSTITVYIGSLYEEDAYSNQKCHIFLGSNRAFTIDIKQSSANTYYYHQDHLGSSNVISDQDGNQAQLLEYTPYGLTNRAEGDYNTNYRFTGKLFDNTDLYYYGARYYDPELGRFITADSIIQSPYDPQSFNRYAYARNNPVKYIDPTGNFFHIIIGAIFGAIIGSAVSAATGGDIGKGAITGAIGGALFGFVGGFDLSGAAQAVAHTWAGATSGVASAAITGGDIGRSALIGGLSAGIACGIGNIIPEFSGNSFGSYLGNVTRRAAIGAVVGGGVSAATGGDFGYGAKQGAISASIAYTANDWLHEHIADPLKNWVKNFLGGGLKPLPGESWNDYSLRHRAEYELHYRIAGALSIKGAVTATSSFASAKFFELSGDYAQYKLSTMSGETLIKGGGLLRYHKGPSYVVRSLERAATVSKVFGVISTGATVAATAYDVGLTVNARLNYHLNR